MFSLFDALSNFLPLFLSPRLYASLRPLGLWAVPGRGISLGDRPSYPEGSSRDQGKHQRQSRRLQKGPLRALPPSVQTASPPERSAAAHQHQGPRTQAVCHEAARGRAPPAAPRTPLLPRPNQASVPRGRSRHPPPLGRPGPHLLAPHHAPYLAPSLAPPRRAARECSQLPTRSADRRRHLARTICALHRNSYAA